MASARTTPEATGALGLHGLRRSFGALVAVDRLSFSVPPGSLFGFVARNGAGKTTGMRIVCGLLAADAGSVSWGARPVDARVGERTGHVREERGLHPNVRLGHRLKYLTGEASGSQSTRTPVIVDRSDGPPGQAREVW